MNAGLTRVNLKRLRAALKRASASEAARRTPNIDRMLLIANAIRSIDIIKQIMLRARERGQESEGDEAWFARQERACIHTDGDGMVWASDEAGERIIAASGSTRSAAIRALRAKVEGGAR